MQTTRYDTHNKDLKYNSYESLSNIPHEILKVLMKSNENIFKLLKYTDDDPLSHDNLTMVEKNELVFKGNRENPNDYDRRIFLIPTTSDATLEQQSQLKIYLENILPVDSMKSLCTFAIEIISSLDVDTYNNGKNTRTLSIVEELLKTLHGCRFDGIVGDLFFNNEASRYCTLKHDIYNQKNYHGYTICLSCYVSTPIVK